MSERPSNVWVGPPAFDASQLSLSESPIISAILAGRGITTDAAVREFLTPRDVAFHDPLLLPDMPRAVEMVRSAIARGERIGIFGDYDVDGITSTAMLTRVLRRLGATVVPMVPHRMDDGYGVTQRTVERVMAEDIQFLITVDCGSSSPNEFAEIHEHGIATVILDHHTYHGELPGECAFVSPRRPDNTYPFGELAAVGVAHALVRALVGEEASEMYLPYVALGTVADVVELTGENRALVARGLAALRRWSLPGFLALCAASGIDRSRVGTFEIGFVLGPRINAAGRIDDPQVALDLLLADDLATAEPLASRLNDLNQQRQDETKLAQSQAEQMVADAGGIDGLPAIVLAHPDWSVGIVGLVAGRLAEAYGRPAVILERGEIESRGSARTAGDIDIHRALTLTEELLTRYGGHSAAAGLSLETERFEEFQRMLMATVLDLCGGELPQRVIQLDAQARHDDLDLRTVKLLDRLEPFGRGNAQPLLLFRGLRHRYPKTSRDGRHLIFQVVDDYGRSHRCVMFNAGDRLREMLATPRIDLATHLTRDEWSGRVELKLRVTDFRAAT
jgi:single-stranded-DNA-specific exonuclease